MSSLLEKGGKDLLRNLHGGAQVIDGRAAGTPLVAARWLCTFDSSGVRP